MSKHEDGKAIFQKVRDGLIAQAEAPDPPQEEIVEALERHRQALSAVIGKIGNCRYVLNPSNTKVQSPSVEIYRAEEGKYLKPRYESEAFVRRHGSFDGDHEDLDSEHDLGGGNVRLNWVIVFKNIARDKSITVFQATHSGEIGNYESDGLSGLYEMPAEPGEELKTVKNCAKLLGSVLDPSQELTGKKLAVSYTYDVNALENGLPPV